MSHPAWAAGWTAPVDRQQVTVAPQPVAGLAALLDADPSISALGAPLPLLWHWAALAQWPPMRLAGPDGHPTTGGFMPPAPYPRRVWLGVTVEVSSPPAVGAEVTVEQTVTGIVEKEGKDGRFAIVTVSTTVTSPADEPLLVEAARIAYRPAAPAAEPASRAGTAGPSALEVTPGGWLARDEDGWTARPNPVVLMRYSALTANGHRIHYDMPYSTQVEGYPSVLVHGPLMATIVAESVRRDHPGRELVGFSCRAQRPYFLGSEATLRVTASAADEVEIALSDTAGGPDARPNLTATVTLR